MTAYTASNITILSPVEVSERFGWAHVAALAAQYRRPEAWIARGLEACRRAGVDDEYFIHRYLRRNANVPCSRLVDAAFRDLLRE